MINSTNSVNIDGTVLSNEDFIKAFTFDKNDRFNHWVVRPLALLTAVGITIATFFASAFIIVLSLAMIPLLALSFWAVKTKIERDMKKNDPVVDTQSMAGNTPASDEQTAS